MEFRPGLPEGNVNISHKTPVKEFLLLFSGIVLILLLVYLLIGLFVDTAVNYISPELEAKIFRPLSSANVEPGHRSQQQQALQSLVSELQQCTSLPYPLHINLVKSDEPNAFAVPGGRIIVFSSLIDSVQSENGLSFVLAHELSHFENRDHLRGMGRSIVFTAVMATLSGAGSDLTKMVTPVSSFSQAQYSQHREAMADRQALAILQCHYGHVGGATEFFQSVATTLKNSGTKSSVSHYFSSHPEAASRISELKRLAVEQQMVVEPVIPLNPIFRQ